MLSAAGTYGYLNPIPCAVFLAPLICTLKPLLILTVAKLFGIPFADSKNALFVPGIGGRNFACGLSILTLAYLEEKRALGVLVGCWTMAGLSDIGILAATEGSNNMFVHARNCVVLLLISYGLLTH